MFFRQQRSSINGRTFILYKFRTMVADAEAQKADLLKHNEMGGPVFKMANDPRVTPLGKYLRKLSIDELPQFWNVFKGDMSIVGPRPPLPSEVKDYDNWHRRQAHVARDGATNVIPIHVRKKEIEKDQVWWIRLRSFDSAFSGFCGYHTEPSLG